MAGAIVIRRRNYIRQQRQTGTRQEASYEIKGKSFFGLFNPPQPVFLMRLKLLRAAKISKNYFLSMVYLHWHYFCFLPFK